MSDEYKKVSWVGVLICCCFGFAFVGFGILSEFAGSGLAYEIGRALGFMIGFSGIFFVMFLDAILERSKKNKKLKADLPLNKSGYVDFIGRGDLIDD